MKGKFPVVQAEVWESEMLLLAAISWCNSCEKPQRQSKGKSTGEHLMGSFSGSRCLVFSAEPKGVRWCQSGSHRCFLLAQLESLQAICPQ